MAAHGVEAILAAGIQGWSADRGWSPVLDGVSLVLVPAALAFSVVVAARFAWLAVAARRTPGRPSLGGLAALFAPARHEVLPDAAPGEVSPSTRAAAAAPVAPVATPAAPAPAPAASPGPGAGEVLRGVASRMDEVTYAPGRPNVLTMTKLVRSVPARADAAPAAAAAAHPEPDPRARFLRTDQGATTVLRIEGVLDAVTASDLRPRLDALLDDGRAHVTVDLSGLELIDSVGVGLLVSFHKRCADAQGDLRVVGLREQPLGIFRLLRLERVLTLS